MLAGLKAYVYADGACPACESVHEEEWKEGEDTTAASLQTLCASVPTPPAG